MTALPLSFGRARTERGLSVFQPSLTVYVCVRVCVRVDERLDVHAGVGRKAY